MTGAHLPSDDTAIRAADERKMLNAERHARETFEAWLTRRQHPVASERLIDAIRAANSERWNQMERALVPMPQGVEPWEDGLALTDRPACGSETGESLTRGSVESDDDGPSAGSIALSVASSKLQALRRAVNGARINPAPVMPERGERKPVP